MSKMTLAVIVGNRDFFPDRLVSEGRADILRLFEEMGIEAVILDEEATKLGAVETWQHARLCADLFRSQRDRIDGVLVCLPNFGDEKGVADTLQLSELNVPVLVQAYPDDLTQLSVERRRDAFCGKVSVCNNLRQYGIAYSLTRRHTVHPLTDSFRADLRNFLAVCRVTRACAGPASVRSARVRMPSTRLVTARSCCSRPASASTPSISLKSLEPRRRFPPTTCASRTTWSASAATHRAAIRPPAP